MVASLGVCFLLFNTVVKTILTKKKGCRDSLKAMLVNMNKDDMKRNKFKEPKFLVVIKVFRTSTEFSLQQPKNKRFLCFEKQTIFKKQHTLNNDSPTLQRHFIGGRLLHFVSLTFVGINL